MLLSVERRRRDKINNWIVTLSKIIPDCSMDSTKTGAVRSLSVDPSTSTDFKLNMSLFIRDRVSVLPEQRRHPVQSLRLHSWAEAKQPATARESEGGGEDTIGQRAVQTAGMKANVALSEVCVTSVMGDRKSMNDNSEYPLRWLGVADK